MKNVGITKETLIKEYSKNLKTEVLLYLSVLVYLAKQTMSGGKIFYEIVRKKSGLMLIKKKI